MEILFVILSILLFILAVIIAYSAIKYFTTMLKYKNRKKDGSEDKDFKYFD